jgi:hypothetical protein
MFHTCHLRPRQISTTEGQLRGLLGRKAVAGRVSAEAQIALAGLRVAEAAVQAELGELEQKGSALVSHGRHHGGGSPVGRVGEAQELLDSFVEGGGGPPLRAAAAAAVGGLLALAERQVDFRFAGSSLLLAYDAVLGAKAQLRARLLDAAQLGPASGATEGQCLVCASRRLAWTQTARAFTVSLPSIGRRVGLLVVPPAGRRDEGLCHGLRAAQRLLAPGRLDPRPRGCVALLHGIDLPSVSRRQPYTGHRPALLALLLQAATMGSVASTDVAVVKHRRGVGQRLVWAVQAGGNWPADLRCAGLWVRATPTHPRCVARPQ